MPRPVPIRNVPASQLRQLCPAADVCQTCAVDHTPDYPHDPGSLYWQIVREMRGEAPPTWDDALAHVPGAVFDTYAPLLAAQGIIVAPREVAHA